MTSIVIAIITYKRPDSLATTLRSLQSLILPDCKVKALVVDNDIECSAKETVETYQPHLPFPLEYRMEPEKGIPYARNRVLEACVNDDYIAFIDDDDTATSSWLISLYDTARRYYVDVVKGQVFYLFPSGHEHLAALDIFAPVAKPTGTRLLSAWSNNVLFSTNIYKDSKLRFDADFAGSGGSDSHFFSTAFEQGAKIVMCAEAIVYSDVTLARTRGQWLAKRHLRVGAAMTVSDMKRRGFFYAIGQMLRSFISSSAYAFRLLRGVIKGKSSLIHPVMVCCFIAGRITGLLKLMPKEYR
jgi:succinoglycan biosynthesis protein ExoM